MIKALANLSGFTPEVNDSHFIFIRFHPRIFKFNCGPWGELSVFFAPFCLCVKNWLCNRIVFG